jgi:hypothetical protein
MTTDDGVNVLTRYKTLVVAMTGRGVIPGWGYDNRGSSQSSRVKSGYLRSCGNLGGIGLFYQYKLIKSQTNAHNWCTRDICSYGWSNCEGRLRIYA